MLFSLLINNVIWDESKTLGAAGESRTHMRVAPQRFLRPSRLPFRHRGTLSQGILACIRPNVEPPIACIANPIAVDRCVYFRIMGHRKTNLA